MYGGHGNRKFYIDQVNRIELEHSNKLPQTKYTNEELQAGFEKLASDFGSYSTLVYMEEKTGTSSKELLTWSLGEYYYRIEYYAWQGSVMKKYNDIINKKMNRKGKR